MDGLRRGDPEIFDRVYAHWRPRLFGFLARLSGRRDLAEDLLQETWIRVAKGAHRLEPQTRLGAWLYTVARNVYLNHRRWAALNAGRFFGFDDAPEPADPETPFDLARAEQLERKLEAALLQLPVKYREVLLLVGVEGLSPNEAAQVLELKADALRQRLKRARDMMQAQLGAELLEAS